MSVAQLANSMLAPNAVGEVPGAGPNINMPLGVKLATLQLENTGGFFGMLNLAPTQVLWLVGEVKGGKPAQCFGKTKVFGTGCNGGLVGAGGAVGWGLACQTEGGAAATNAVVLLAIDGSGKDFGVARMGPSQPCELAGGLGMAGGVCGMLDTGGPPGVPTRAAPVGDVGTSPGKEVDDVSDEPARGGRSCGAGTFRGGCGGFGHRLGQRSFLLRTRWRLLRRLWRWPGAGRLVGHHRVCHGLLAGDRRGLKGVGRQACGGLGLRGVGLNRWPCPPTSPCGQLMAARDRQQQVA